MIIFDAHVRIGRQRDVALEVDDLLQDMTRRAVDRALIAPSEREIAVANADGNAATAAAARRSEGRLAAYAVASPWLGAEAVALLQRARDDGAVALAVDSALQGFDLLDGLVDPLIEFAAAAGWPVYVRTGSPPGHLPLPLALLAQRYPEVGFVMGRSGATDFWVDAAPALRQAPNLFGDISYAPWDTLLTELVDDPAIGFDRLVFSTDAPYGSPATALATLAEWPVDADDKQKVAASNLERLLGGGWRG